MSGPAITEERNIANALISGLANMKETPTREQVEKKAQQIAELFGYTGELRNIITEAMISVDTRMGAGVSLVDPAAKHDDQWVRKREDITWTYANAYGKFLREEGWPPRMVQSLSDVTDRILGHLQDPRSDGTNWNRRGLVIGHVQSGKTANYTGLIARATANWSVWVMSTCARRRRPFWCSTIHVCACSRMWEIASSCVASRICRLSGDDVLLSRASWPVNRWCPG